MRKPTSREIKIAGSISVAHRILAVACTRFKTESPLYHHKIKKMCNSLLETVTHLISFSRSEKFILLAEKDNGYKIDREDLNEDDALNLACVESFVDIIMNCEPVQIMDLSIALDNIKAGKKMYTENELQILKDKLNEA